MQKMINKTKPLLVHEYLERVGGEVLEEKNFQSALAGMIKGHKGVYVLYKDDRLYYVGLASNLMGRVKQHTTDRHGGQWNRFSVYLTEASHHIKPLESLLLRILQPTGNRVKGKITGASDLKPALAKLVKKADDADRHQALGRKKIISKKLPAYSQNKEVVKSKFPKCAIRATYKGETYKANLKNDGSVRYDGVDYKTPSGAAMAIAKRNVNGWSFWHYKENEDWISISHLRK